MASAFRKWKGFTSLFVITLFLVLTLLASKWISIHNIDNSSSLLKYFTVRFANISSIPESKTHFICADFIGGLGNNMFQFASAFGIAKMKNMSVIVASNEKIREPFNLGKNIGTDQRPCRSAQIVHERWYCAFDENILKIDNKHDYRLKKHLQSWKYFKHAEDDLRKQFTFKENITALVSNITNKILLKYRKSRQNTTLIGIHVRRGDKAIPNKDFTVATKEYFAKAIAYYKSKFVNIIFIVCSTDMVWSKETIKNIKNKDDIYEFIEKGSRDADLALLGSCDHVIQSVGTYSWWAAWLAGGTSVFYKWPAKNGSRFRKQYSKDYSDHFYPGWIGI